MDIHRADGGAQGFTCSTCRLTFPTVDAQRAHFKGPLHAFNVRRKVVNMVPVTQEQFDARVHESVEAPKKETITLYHCRLCRKTVKSREMAEQHLETKKHLQKAKKVPAEERDNCIEIRHKEIDEEAERPQGEKKRLGFLQCPFCTHPEFESAEETAEHMSDEHGFFIPDIEYLVDLKGLIAYIGDKVGVGHCCLYCHKMFDSMQAARDHMSDVGHQKMVYNDDEDEEAGEFDDFYDFSATYLEENLKKLPNLTVSEDGSSLIIGDSGKSVGHRDLQVYYNQNISNRNREVVVKTNNRLLQKYKALGWTGVKTSKETVEARRARQYAHQQQKKKDLSVGTQTQIVNRKYFRRRDLAW